MPNLPVRPPVCLANADFFRLFRSTTHQTDVTLTYTDSALQPRM